MKKYLFLLFVSFNFISYSQIVVDNTDLPVAGKYYTLSNTVNVNGVDFTQTGANYTWDFSKLTSLSQTTDTFASVSSAPIVYKLVFSNGKSKSTVAEPDKALTLDTIVTLTDVYNFFVLSDTAYKQTGYAGTLDGLTIPLAYSNLDRIYKLPLQFGNTDSCVASLSMSMNSIGYISQVKHRKNTVDGWGTLKTPYGTFQTLRVKSEITEKDSAKLDTLGMSFPAVNRVYTEYKWLAKGFADPMLYITQEGLVTTVNYIDSLRMHSGINEYSEKYNLNVYPNPAIDKINISYNLLKPIKAEIVLSDILGNEIKKIECTNQNSGLNTIVIPIEKYKIKPGIYLLNLKTDKGNVVKKVIIY